MTGFVDLCLSVDDWLIAPLCTEIVELVREPRGGNLFRPNTAILDYQNYILATMKDCWEESPWARPDFRLIRCRLKPMREGM